MVPALITCCIVLAAALVARCWTAARQKAGLRDGIGRLEEELDGVRGSLDSERRATVNALTDAFLLIDREGYIHLANAPAADLFRGRVLESRHIEEVLLDDRLSSPIRDALASNENISRRIILPQQASPLGTEDRRGETAWVVDAGPMSPTASADPIRVIIRDVTTEHQIEQVRKDFVANASHELRTPLAIINGYLENLVEDNVIEDPGMARRFLTIMRKHGERVARITEDMLLISRLESGEAARIKPAPFQLDDCVNDVLERLEPMISAQDARVRLRFAKKGITVVADRFYWTQILFNLVENALKQNPNAPIRIEIGSRFREEDGLQIWVADNGVGIPSADLPFIFRRFYRVEKHHSQGEIKGTGLGLSIVRRAVEAHGGNITVSSTPGQETRFVMTLPSAAVASSSANKKGTPK